MSRATYRTLTGAILHTRWDDDGTVTIRTGDAAPYKVKAAEMRAAIINHKMKKIGNKYDTSTSTPTTSPGSRQS